MLAFENCIHFWDEHWRHFHLLFNDCCIHVQNVFTDVEKKKQKRGGKAQKEKMTKKTEAAQAEQKIELQVVTEGRRSKTRITGFHTFDIKVNEAKKTLAKKLGAGCTLEANTVVLQGDNLDYLVDNLPKLFPCIPADAIVEL